VFPASASGGLRDPSNTAAHLHTALKAAGRGELSSHVCRRTVATLMHDAGIDDRSIADQLGHRSTTVTNDRYLVTRAVRTGAAQVLADLDL
jgi:integrase